MSNCDIKSEIMEETSSMLAKCSSLKTRINEAAQKSVSPLDAIKLRTILGMVHDVKTSLARIRIEANELGASVDAPIVSNEELVALLQQLALKLSK